MSTTRFLIASNNPGKQREMRALLAHIPIELVVPQDLGLTIEPSETGGTYCSNAAIKAREFATASGLWAIADDTGIEIAALGGAPGPHAKRFAGPDATDADRRRKILDLLRGMPSSERGATFVCCIVAASPSGTIIEAVGSLTGRITNEERGEGGFGYDSIFQGTHTGQTLAEMSTDEKNRISHRARAVAAIAPRLIELASHA